MVDRFSSQQHLAIRALGLGLSMNGCMSSLDDYKFHVCDSFYQNWVAISLERSFLEHFHVSR